MDERLRSTKRFIHCTTTTGPERIDDFSRRFTGCCLRHVVLPHRRGAGKAVKAIYAKRMGIEEAFRDVKNHRWGFALRYARSQSARRVEILLLIATLAASVQWLMGLAAKAKRWERHFQANTERKRRVLSTVFIGNELMRSPRFKPKRIEIIDAFKCLCRLIKRDASYA